MNPLYAIGKIVVALLILLVTVIFGQKAIYKYRPMEGGGESLHNNYVGQYVNLDDLQCKFVCTYEDLVEEIPYSTKRPAAPNSVHIGQLKLFLSELQFLTEFLEHHDDNATVVYAGSSPSQKIFHLMKMFPNTTFILIDPNEHEIRWPFGNQYDSSDRVSTLMYFKAADGNRFKYKYRPIQQHDNNVIDRNKETLEELPLDNWIDTITANINIKAFIYEDLMTDEIAAELSKLPGAIYYISDIRTHDEKLGFPSDMNILVDSAMQYNWIKLLKPIASMLKFHPPYFTNDSEVVDHPAFKDIEFVANFKEGKFRYLDGKINMQAFPGKNSSETRLIVSDRDLPLKFYDNTSWENKFAYHNHVVRAYCKFEHPQKVAIDGLDKCYDCNLMLSIYKDYYDKYKLQNNTQEDIITLLKTIRRRLDSGDHGKLE